MGGYAAGMVLAAALTVACCAGCTAVGGAVSGPRTGRVTATGTAGGGSGGDGATSAHIAIPDRALASPGCSTAVTSAGMLGSARTAMLPVGHGPFGVAATPDGRFAFVVMSGIGTGATVKVLRLNGTSKPAAVRSVRVPGPALGAAITPDGRYLLIADSRDGATVLSVARAESGAAGAVLGTLSAPSSGTGPAAGSGPGRLSGAIEVTTSPDGRFAFVTLEGAQRAAVYNLAESVADGFRKPSYVGAIPLGGAPVGITVSPDGRWLYATSELAKGKGTPAGSLRPVKAAPSAPPRALAPRPYTEPPGTLTVVNLREAETDPARSVVATVAAGCEPVRVVTSDNGALVWVTARASDDLLCFAAARLASDPTRALVAVTRVGEAPVGLAAVAGGSLIVVADSNRFRAAGRHADLSVVSVADALSRSVAGGGARAGAVLGRVPSGLFPRDMTVAAGGGVLLVSNYVSGQLEAVDVASLAGLPRARASAGNGGAYLSLARYQAS
jgi:DNA-binding beta-propeller fold protein YncE